MHGKRADFTGLVLDCIEADFCNPVLVGKNGGKALAEIYTMHFVLQLSNLKVSVKKLTMFVEYAKFHYILPELY